MKIIYLAVLAAGLNLSAQAGKPPSCSDAAVTFTIGDDNPGMSSDGQGPYQNGIGGVIARLNCNGDSLELSGARPSILNLGTALNGTAPAWASSPAPVSFFNIPLGSLFNNAQPYPYYYSLTTYFKVTMASPNLGYFFNMENPSANIGGLQAPGSGVNTPIMTALVNVTHYPAGTYLGNSSAPETWIVSPADPPVGTLQSNLKGGVRSVAQFNLPFNITVTRQ
jgi:hypothetical protein